jgi:chromosome segregation ATPase
MEVSNSHQIDSLIDSFGKQHKVYVDLNSSHQKFQNIIKLNDDKIAEYNEKISQHQNEISAMEERLRKSQSLKQKLQENLQQLYSSKPNMQSTIQAIDSKLSFIQETNQKEISELDTELNKLMCVYEQNSELISKISNEGTVQTC